jgi:hypothetical protein
MRVKAVWIKGFQQRFLLSGEKFWTAGRAGDFPSCHRDE